MKVIIAEKPSVAREIATIVGATEKKNGYLFGNGYAVTWALGHLISLAMPNDYGIAGFNRESLPILPSPFKLVIRQEKVGKEYRTDSGAKKQLEIIRTLFEEAESIIVATDAGREGELIFRYIYSYLKCDKPFERLWINSLTDKAIRNGMNNLQKGSEYDNLYLAAKGRSEADWLIGINATQALSISAGYGIYSLGRVQTPTLMMICKRFEENTHFTSKKYWQIEISGNKNDLAFSICSKAKFESIETVNSTIKAIEKKREGYVSDIEINELHQEPPLLYDLTSLQKEANSKFGYSADNTLTIAQSLYEKKLLSYPRTGSRFISDDVFEDINNLIGLLKQYPDLSAYARLLHNSSLNPHSVNTNKVTDHHALIITENIPQSLSKEEKDIYDLVASRFLEAFSSKSVRDITTVSVHADEFLFELKGIVTKNEGWRAVRNEKEEDQNALPVFYSGEYFPIDKIFAVEKQTKPKALHTESSLLTAMETAGKELKNEEERQAIKASGIGTPATRASIIETLIGRDYIRREKKSLVPTEKGLSVFKVVKDKKIADVQMTGMWENTLAQIERGEYSESVFSESIATYATQITEELLSTQIESTKKSTCSCPRCGMENMLFFEKVVKCRNVDCGVTVYRERSGKKLSENHVLDLLTKGKTSIIKGFKSKTGKIFDASLGFDEKHSVVFVFPVKKNK